MRYALPFLLAWMAAAQSPPETYHIGPEVSRPRLIKKVQPGYTREAVRERIAGSVELEIVIDESGRPVDIQVLSPLGFGLDQRAVSAVRQWRFAPAMKAGKPVRVYATVQINFEMPGSTLDKKAEEQRTKYNIAVNELSRGTEAREQGRKTILDLSMKQFPPAMFTAGIWKISGEVGDKDVAAGLALIQKSADKDYAPALYEIAVREIDGRDLPRDFDKGLETMRHAATLGSVQALYSLGQRYQTGIGVEAEPERARHYFHLCATAGVAACQLKLAESLLAKERRSERDYVQAIAWLELAEAQKLSEASHLLDRERPRVTDDQLKWAESIKVNLLRH